MATIENNVPIPTTATGGRKPRYEFHKLEVGQSVLEDGPPKGIDKRTHILRIRASLRGHAAQSQCGKKFVTRVEGDTLRIWRTE